MMKNSTDLEFNMIFQETVNKFTQMTDYECKNYILSIKNDENIDEKLKINLLKFYLNVYKITMKNRLYV